MYGTTKKVWIACLDYNVPNDPMCFTKRRNEPAHAFSSRGVFAESPRIYVPARLWTRRVGVHVVTRATAGARGRAHGKKADGSNQSQGVHFFVDGRWAKSHRHLRSQTE